MLGHPVGIAAAVKFFMVGSSDTGNVGEFFGPRNVFEESLSVNNMRFYLKTLAGAQAPS